MRSFLRGTKKPIESDDLSQSASQTRHPRRLPFPGLHLARSRRRLRPLFFSRNRQHHPARRPYRCPPPATVRRPASAHRAMAAAARRLRPHRPQQRARQRAASNLCSRPSSPPSAAKQNSKPNPGPAKQGPVSPGPASPTPAPPTRPPSIAKLSSASATRPSSRLSTPPPASPLRTASSAARFSSPKPPSPA